jgi:hypothetical protein
MTIKSFKTKFKIFGESENPVNFGDQDNPRPISAKPPEIKGSHVELFEGDADSLCLTAKQLYDHVKSLKGCDDFELFFAPAGGGEWPVELVSPWPKNGVVFLDCNTEISG